MSIIVKRDGDILFLSLNRPEAGNRVDPESIAQLTNQFGDADPLASGPAVIVLGAVGSDFSLGRQRPAEQSADPLDITREFEAIQNLNEAVQRCRAVTIAAVRGRAEGAGLSLGLPLTFGQSHPLVNYLALRVFSQH